MSDNSEDELELLTVGPRNADWTLILAHGAGQDMRSSFMAHIAGALGRAGVRVVRFEFPYMAETRRTGNRRPPNRKPVLLER
jgi:predicted alpha/beta-hydrolase family hydrolase